jgi:hypothetical protein
VPYDTEFFTPGGITAEPRRAQETEPGWLDTSPGHATALPGRGQMPLFPESGTLPVATKVFTAATMFGMLAGLNNWARPTLKASKLQQRRGTWGFLQRTLDSIQGFLDHGTNAVGHEVSKGAAHNAHGLAYTLGLSGDRWNQIVWNVAYNQAASEYATRRIVHTIIPRQINHKVNPVITRVHRTETQVKRHGKQITIIRTYVTHQITKVLKPRITRIERTVTKTLPARITRVERTVRKTQVRQKHDHKLIVKLISLLTVTGAVSLVLKAFGRLGLNFLRCQNVKDFGNELCPSPPGSGRGLARFGRNFGSLLGDLAALTFVPFLLTEACAIVTQIEKLAIAVQPEIDALVLGIEGFVCGGTANLPSAIEPSDLKRAAPLPSGL